MEHDPPRRSSRLHLSPGFILLLLAAALTLNLIPSAFAITSNVSVVQAPLFQPGAPSASFNLTTNYTSNVTADRVILGYTVLDLNQTCCVSFGSGIANLTSPANGSYTFNVTLASTPSSTALLGVKVYLISSTQYSVNAATAYSRATVNAMQPISVLPDNALTVLYAPPVLPSANGAKFNIILKYTTNIYWTSLYAQVDTVRALFTLTAGNGARHRTAGPERSEQQSIVTADTDGLSPVDVLCLTAL